MNIHDLLTDYPAGHLHPELANTFRDICEKLEQLEPGTWLYDQVLASVVCSIGGLCRDALLGQHSDGRPLLGTKKYDERKARGPVWDEVACNWRTAYGHELTDDEDAGSLSKTSPKRLTA